SLVLVVRVQRAPSCPVLTNASTTAWSGPVPSRPATKWRGGTVDRHGRVSLDPEPPGVCGALPARSADPHAWSGPEACGRHAASDQSDRPAVEQVDAVVIHRQ